jgi:predicted GH43/DUF377 family glycosyl hydrolase
MVTRSEVTLRADPSRVLARLFVPGHELVLEGVSRASGVMARILDLPEDTVGSLLRDVCARYDDRHRDLSAVFLANYERIAHRVPTGTSLTPERRSLLGAWFTNEYSIEAAALFNPSVVAHPDQTGVDPGWCRFVMSLRAVGEGHISSVEFRTGILGPEGQLRVDDPGVHVESGSVRTTWHDRELFAAKLAEEGADEESSSFLVDRLPGRFTDDELEDALSALSAQRLTRSGGARADELARRIAGCSYEVAFSTQSSLAERVLWPHSPAESHGIEDVRLVRFVGNDGSVTFRGTYTAFDGQRIAPHVIETSDFRHYRASQLAGPAARNKGMALFPRTVSGRYFALSRWDRENCDVVSSVDGLWWDDPQRVYTPSQPWELIQTGNCGSPIETAAGWLVLTHGVGPMREYAIGALLLDLDDPTVVLGSLDAPLMRPGEDERNGYVPNVVYSCGALLHGDQLLLPYGASDSSVRFAFVDAPMLLERLTAGPPPKAMRSNSRA